MKVNKAWSEFDSLAKDVESFLVQVPAKDRREMGVLLCQSVAVFSSKQVKKEGDVFEPLKIISEARDELQGLIAEFIDEQIEEELTEYIKENK